jgi:hypothetical protein
MRLVACCVLALVTPARLLTAHPVTPVAVAGLRPAVRSRLPALLAAQPDASECYRLLGLAEDANYDEIEAAFEDLVTKYADDPKRKIKLQVAKDKILEDRLRQRMSGSLKGAAPINPFERPEAPKPLITIPPFLADVMELPTRAMLLKNAAVFGAIGLLPALSRTWASTSVGLGFAYAFYSLYNRGVPDGGGLSGGEMRPPKPKPLALAGGITFFAAALGATASQVLYGFVRRLVTQELVIALSISFSFVLSTSLCAHASDSNA